MRILHLLTSDRFSGAENVVCQIINLFNAESGIEMIYCSPDGEIEKSLKERGIPFSPLSNFSFSSVHNKISKIKPDIIHAHDMRASVMATLAAPNIPLISHIHVNNYDTRALSVKAILYYIAAIKAKHIFWVSRSSFDGYLFHNKLKNKSEVLTNIIDISMLFEKAREDNNTYHYDIVYLGRLSTQKNPQKLMRVIGGVVKAFPDVKVAVIGTGELLETVRKQAGEYGIDKNVDFLGFVSNPYKMLQDAKIMLMTSRWEGTPMSALEAMSLGIPIVSTPVDGMLDIVSNGVTGFLADSDDGLVDYCNQLMGDPIKQQAFSAASLQRAKKLMDVEMYKKPLLDAYIDAINKTKGSGV